MWVTDGAQKQDRSQSGTLDAFKMDVSLWPRLQRLSSVIHQQFGREGRRVFSSKLWVERQRLLRKSRD